MRLSQELEEAVFVFSDDQLLGFLSEDVIHNMEVGHFTPESVQEAFVEIFTVYRLDESDMSMVSESIDTFGQSVGGLEEGFVKWLKGAAKKALKAAGEAALDAAREGGKEAVATTAKELNKKLADKKKQDKEDNKKDTKMDDEDESANDKDEKEVSKSKSKSKSEKVKSKPKEKESEKDNDSDEEEPEKEKSKSKPGKKKSKSKKEEPKEEPKKKDEPEKDDDKDDDEDKDDIKGNLKNIARKTLGKISDDPGKAKEYLKRGGKKAARALAKHGVKKGMKMVFGRWVKKGSGDSKKEAIEWLAANSEVFNVGESLIVHDLHEKVPGWITEAFCGDYQGVGDGFRYEFVPGEDTDHFMMVEER